MAGRSLLLLLSILLVAFPLVMSQDGDLSELTIQELIPLGETEEIASRIVASENFPFLAESFTFAEADREQATAQSSNRFNDPDVVVFRALATAALTPEQSRKLATVARLSVFPYGGSTLRDVLKLQNDLNDDFANVELMEEILAANPNEPSVTGSNRRRLLCDGCSPANSFVCSSCWPKKVCNKFFWC